MTTPKDKLKPIKCATSIGAPTEWPPAGRLARPIVYQLRTATDWFAVLGVGSAVVAFLLWTWPESYAAGNFRLGVSADRLPVVAAFLALSFILLLLRRR